MIKRIAFVRRHPNLDVEEFHARWSGPYAELVAANPAAGEHLQRYRQHPRKPRDYDRPDVAYDGAEVQWFDSREGYEAMLADPGYAEVLAAQAELFAPGETLETLTSEEQVVIPGPDERETPLTVLVCGVRKKPGMDRDEFHRYWWEVHGPLNRDTPAVRQYFIRYEQNHRLPEDFARDSSEIEGVTIEWFPSTRHFFGMATDPESRDVISADEQKFLDTDRLVWILAEAEHTVLDRIP
jgi:uncharacterized protein (TIGR02118 family)